MTPKENLPSVAIASCSSSARGLATKILSQAPAYRDVDIVMTIPHIEQPVAFNGFESMIEASFASTFGLLTTSKADLAVSLARERVTVRRARERRTFSVGLVVSCYRHGPLFFARDVNWVPEHERELFDEKLLTLLTQLQESAVEPPVDDVVNVAKIITRSLMQIQLDVEEERIPAIH